jgi:hypothetical protein
MTEQIEQTTTQPTAQATEIKGGVIIQGSLFWENENNCIPGDEVKGNARREWRENRLNLKDSFPIPFPLRYGRCSSSRLCTYTMVMSENYLANDKIGQAKVAPFHKTFQTSNMAEITTEITELTKVEGISEGKYFAKGFSAIAIWINPNSQFETNLETYWNGLLTQYGYQNNYTYNWSDRTLISQDYKLGLTLGVEDLDFLLLTYMQPKHRVLSLDQQQQYPTPKEIAEEIKRTGYSTYFCQNRVSGIITSDDEEIFKYIK